MCHCCFLLPQLFVDGPPTSAEEAHKVRRQCVRDAMHAVMTSSDSSVLLARLASAQGLVRAYGSLEVALSHAQRA